MLFHVSDHLPGAKHQAAFGARPQFAWPAIREPAAVLAENHGIRYRLDFGFRDP